MTALRRRMREDLQLRGLAPKTPQCYLEAVKHLAQYDRRARVIEHYFHLLPDSLATYHAWRQLIVRYAVVGAQVHDARLVASMNAYGISHLLTFNADHFRRYQDVTVLEPQHVRPT
jgi:hypothetical protein